MLRHASMGLVLFLLACGGDDSRPRASGDAGRLDGGSADAGTEPMDAGRDQDASTMGMDAAVMDGSTADAGDTDGGPVDAGISDGGVADAGTTVYDGTSGTVGIELQSLSQGHSHAVKLDEDHVVVAATAEAWGVVPSQVRFWVVSRSGDTFTVGPENVLAIPTLDAAIGSGILLMGALGPSHFVMVTQAEGHVRTMRLLRRTGNLVEELESMAIDWAWLGGEPIDDTRYLFRYRNGPSSIDPVHFRVIRLAGDTMVLEPPVERYGPGAFTGLAAGEPQTFSPVVRAGPTSFREVRGNYVYMPGYLGVSTLTLGTDNSLGLSDPLVFDNSATRSMEPLVAANGTGEAVVLYRSYDVGWFYGSLTEGLSTFTQGTMLEPDRGFFGGQSGWSTDGFIDGRYYIRLQTGELYRWDTVDATPVLEEEELPWSWCPPAPSVMRMGEWGAFLVCDGAPLRLELRKL